ncbi:MULTISPECIES: D-alanine--D-alanine ligase family protein [Prochlorococcus]|uniref:D-alanine--D-alanine ligase n=2 Tax=Prochlorococcus marinus TaxID=1219 RepID=DDL_PROMA|nr:MULTISPECIES: D-alanine--D-alanine ligase family protein [Prochlorococcus]Q7VAS4.1 RecName: Full=D-alanine--D-alanine ligase; AltName: Full=D-Ala-D-Ala ligase; AltName: Full=D-alanylalanine synthetase [Prochlorococcus marinus subsp. marinus str. CCMP1375]AAQ00424.1 D-alanine-D-alanine ligase and related ATP-grasp enzymes [Prochlorococcus marinus subsp. marinus str. CCMP1375]
MRNAIKTVGIVFGGVSGEHEVSIKSARTIIHALKHPININKFDVISIYIDKKGKWWPSEIAEKVLESDPNFDKNIFFKQVEFIGLDHLPKETEKIQIWFPVLHGPNGEDGSIQGFFQLTGKPYVGSGVLGSALGMDKIAMKAAFSAAGLPQVNYCEIHSIDLLDKKRLSYLIQKIETQLGYPCFIKPANLGSSVGISKAYDKKELLNGLDLAAQLDSRIVVEKNIKARELECAVIGKKQIKTSCVGEVRYSSDWYDYDSKYSKNSTKTLIPAPIPEKISKEVQSLSILACKAISAEGIARVDFFYDEEKDSLWINEINTMPGFTEQSMYPMLWDASGIDISQLVARLIESA